MNFEQREEGARLSIVDNGRGFDPATTAPDRMGMASMYERAAAVQAQLKLSSQPGVGTQLHLSWQPTATDGEGASP